MFEQLYEVAAVAVARPANQDSTVGQTAPPKHCNAHNHHILVPRWHASAAAVLRARRLTTSVVAALLRCQTKATTNAAAAAAAA
eukprot:CAMPEP_0177400662 /NCGR_PEP_ID=MMETSP0368-20130122/59218_1 /TAXON_ID=447022 ORGANISM="Scrippsiella hangoei-like, Strain SHHI-4" /NCGR_SAMPLE_ID=MMETSP0368 /ASSEMBLY_ACC=CAM_ASM_000363 /LENGTH=83 /DNA_ID=CAMNT_0018868155 /DNA_START=62 /DNA_END=310 /DNA_ORIENTATION=+